MTILFFEEFPDSSSLSWGAVRADPVVFKMTPGGKESLVVCFKDGRVYEYYGTKTKGDFSAREVFNTMKSAKMSPKMGTQKSPGTYFASIQSQLRLYKSNGKFDSFEEFHQKIYGTIWKAAIQEHPPVRVWAGRLVGW